jgi:hypothetical protein
VAAAADASPNATATPPVKVSERPWWWEPVINGFAREAAKQIFDSLRDLAS